MLILNPKELPLCHKYYSPTQEEVLWANEMISSYEMSKAEGYGVAVKNNIFIGPPMVKMAQKVLCKYKKIEVK